MTEIQEKLVDVCLDKIGVSDAKRRANFKLFLDQCEILNPNIKWYERTMSTKANIIALYKKLDHPIKRASKILGLEYKELAEKIGYSEYGLKSAVIKNEISKPMQRALELLIEVEQHKKTIRELTAKLNIIENTLEK